MSQSVLFRYQGIDDRGVISGALIHFRQGRAPGQIFTDKAMRIPGRNPLPANGVGRAVAYLPLGEEYEVTVTRPDGSFVEQFEHTALPAGETVTIQPEPEIIEKVVEVPVEVERIVEVEKIVYRDNPAEKMLAELEAVQTKLQERPEAHVEPPAAIADLFQADRPLAEQAKALRELWLKIGHQIHRGEATPDEIRKHERLSSELQFLNKHAFDGV